MDREPFQSPSSYLSSRVWPVMPFHFSSTGEAAQRGPRPSACRPTATTSQSLRSIRLLQHSACHPCPGGPKAVPRGGWHPLEGTSSTNCILQKRSRDRLNGSRRPRSDIHLGQSGTLSETLPELLVRTRNQIHRGVKFTAVRGSRCTCHQTCKDLPN